MVIRWCLLRVVVLLGILLSIPMVQAANIVILLSAQGGAYSEVAESLQVELVRQGFASRISTLVVGGSTSEELSVLSPNLVVAVGAKATQLAVSGGDPRVPVLSLLTPRSTIQAMVSLIRSRGGDPRRFAGLYLEQPLARYFELVRLVFGSGSRVGVLLGPDSRQDLDFLLAQASPRGVHLTYEFVERASEIYPALQRLAAQSDVLLLIPDRSAVNLETAQNLLLGALRLRLPVIGYSSTFVRAGAALALYSKPAQIGSEGSEFAKLLLKGGGGGGGRYPKSLAVEVNALVAKSLGLQIESEGTRDRLMKVAE